MPPLARRTGLLLALLAPATPAQFVRNGTDIPSGAPDNASYTENVDFADVDLDGDWDAAFADGGDQGNDQNRLWIDQGGVQGGVRGHFLDETAARLPAVQDASRDVEFADIDGDGDQDLFVANHSTLTSQASRWWVNLGGSQRGNVGYFEDQTASRWVGVGGPGSSVWPGQVLASGGFVAWCGDGDFADLDGDGDLDLVHSSYGPFFSGQVPTRLFLNDGNGFFSELNPGGAQLAGSLIEEGAPGLWCEGLQQSGTLDSTGAFCDVASTALDVDLADIDQDFDLDLLHGARDELPRMFANRSEASTLAPGGELVFRDVTGLVFPPGYANGTGQYEQELGDLDGDGDLDLVGVNWGFSAFAYHDVTLTNLGDGTFGQRTLLPGSQPDDNEADFLDYDSDGDLDLYITNFSGQDRLYRNDNDGGTGFSFTNVTADLLPALTEVGLDADAADLDGDGDPDLMVAANFGQANVLVENVGDQADTTAPFLPLVEQAPDRACGYEPTVVRAHVLDNAPLYMSRFGETFVTVEVDGQFLMEVPASSSGGQVFRAAIPGWISGTVCLTWTARDEYGNEGRSATTCYEASGTCTAPQTFCDPPGGNSVTAAGARLSHVSGTPGGTLVLRVDDVPAGQFGILYYGSDQIDLPFGCGRRCVTGNVVRSSPYLLSAFSQQLVLATEPPALVPDPFRVQFWYRDPANLASCGSAFNLSTALSF